MHATRDTDRGADEAAELAASSGDEDAFRRLTEPYTRELHVHCYRMLGSFHDAEDALQETLLRAWRHLAGFEGRSSLRAWLYRIATNVCLARAARPRSEPLPLPPSLNAPEPAHDPHGPGIEQVAHLTPYPDALLDALEATSGNPAAVYDVRESVQLAFLAAVQMLPPRQRAVLILRDVLRWSAGEVADLLGTTTASVNSALQRARATLDQWRVEGRLRAERAASADEVERSLVRRYVAAWEAVDIDGLVHLLRSDAVLTMPPYGARYEGRAAVQGFFAAILAGRAPGQIRVVPTRANRRPALAFYRRDPDGATYRAVGILVVVVEGAAIAEIVGFLDPTLFPSFGLPTRRDA